MNKKPGKKSLTMNGASTMNSPTFYNFLRAVVFDRQEAHRMLQEDQGWLRATNSLDETALHYLAVENNVDGVRYLLAKGAAVDGAQEYGSPLTDAARVGHVDMVALLIEQGANLEARDSDDRTALLLAAQYGYANICDVLLAAGADIDARDDSGYSVMDVALVRKRKQIAAVLFRHGPH